MLELLFPDKEASISGEANRGSAALPEVYQMSTFRKRHGIQ